MNSKQPATLAVIGGVHHHIDLTAEGLERIGNYSPFAHPSDPNM